MPYKPWIIIFLSIVYFISPPVILISSSYVSLVPLTGPYGVLSRLTPSDISILATYILIGICLLSMRKWGWWGFIGFSLYLISYNLIAFLRNPFYSPLSLIVFTVLLTTAAGLLFRKELIAPYFNPKLRWWESEKRYDLSFRCRMHFGEESMSVPVYDISRGGCFLAVDRPAPLSRILTLEITINRLYLTLKGEVVRSSDTPVKGWGILFKDMSMMETRGMKELIHLLKFYHGEVHDERGKRKHRRYANPFVVYLGGEGIEGTQSLRGMLENISRTGFCLALEEGERLTGNSGINLDFPGNTEGPVESLIALPAEIVWKKEEEEILILGAEFIKNDRNINKRINRMIRHYRKLGGSDRRSKGVRDNRLIEESLALTPRGRLRSFLKA